MSKQWELLVGDNAFHGISHLSQQRARQRAASEDPSNAEYAAKLVNLSLKNGATGFIFSVSEITLSILKALDPAETPGLFAIVPYAYEYVRKATRVGGISGLTKHLSKQIVFSRNIIDVLPNLVDLIKFDPSAFLKTYLIYEIWRIKSAAGKNANLKSILLHEVITDMALALGLEELFKSYINFLLKRKIRPGFETRNFPHLIEKFAEWQINMNEITIAASFNQIGFQMNPSQKDCEQALKSIDGAELIAFSILASGHLQLREAINYLHSLPNLSGIVAGVSKVRHAEETFKLLNENFHNQ